MLHNDCWRSINTYLHPSQQLFLRATCRMFRSIIPATCNHEDTLTHCCQHGYIDQLRLISFNVERKYQIYYQELWEDAAENGHLEVMQWLDDNWAVTYKSMAPHVAALNGHLHILEWLQNKQILNLIGDETGIYTGAAKSGHLYIIKWAYQHGFDWDDKTASMAAEGDHLEVLKWLRQHGCPWDKWTTYRAAEYGHLEVLKWAHQNGCPVEDRTIEFAALNGHLEIVKWFVEGSFIFDREETLVRAVQGRHLHILEWALANGWDFTDNVATRGYSKTCLDNTATCKYLQVLTWLLDHNCPINVSSIALQACRSNDIAVAKWCCRNGTLIDADILEDAVMHGSLDIIKLVFEDEQLATSSGIRWLHKEGCYAAAVHVRVEMLKLLRHYECSWDEETCIAMVNSVSVKYRLEDKIIDTVKWAVTNGCPYSIKLIRRAAEMGLNDLVTFLRRWK